MQKLKTCLSICVLTLVLLAGFVTTAKANIPWCDCTTWTFPQVRGVMVVTPTTCFCIDDVCWT
jgi:hypothetical protein